MADIILTPSDTSVIQSAILLVTGSVSVVSVDMGSPGFRIAALRYNLGHNERSMRSVNDRLQIALCKMIALHPGSSDDFIVQKVLPGNFTSKYPILGRLYTTYQNRVYQSGQGFWANRAHESVLSALYGSIGGGASPVLISRIALQSLYAAYKTQLAKAQAEEPIALPTKANLRDKLADDASVRTIHDRKRAASDVRGKCYNCDAPKPRKVQCAVCGYIPRGA